MREPPKANNRPGYRQILLIRTDRVGDLILSTPAIASFRRSWPQARIETLVTDYTEPVLRYNPDVDAVHALPRSDLKVHGRRMARSLGRGADIAVALAPRTADYRLAAWTRVPRRIGHVYERRYLSRVAARLLLTEHCLSSADPELSERSPDRPVLHEVKQVLQLVKLAGGQVFSEELVLRTGDEDTAFARGHVAKGAIGVNLSPRWFAQNFGFKAVKTLIEKLAAQRRDVIVIHGNDVSDVAASLRVAVADARVSWFSGLSMLQWAAVLGRCSVVVTVDTGATHVAAAMRVPVVVVFEREYYRLSSQEWGPWRVPSALLRKPIAGTDPAALIHEILAAALSLSTVRVETPS